MINAPLPPIPVPFSVSAFALIKVCPFKSTTAPDVTETPPAAPPNAVPEPACSVPALTVVAPLYVFAPDSVVIPEPFWVSASVPVPFESTPLENVVLLLPDTVSVLLPPTVVLTSPVKVAPPESPSLIVLLALTEMVRALLNTLEPVRLSVPPPSVIPPELLPRLPSLDTAKVPALIMVPPP